MVLNPANTKKKQRPRRKTLNILSLAFPEEMSVPASSSPAIFVYKLCETLVRILLIVASSCTSTKLMKNTQLDNRNATDKALKYAA